MIALIALAAAMYLALRNHLWFRIVLPQLKQSAKGGDDALLCLVLVDPKTASHCVRFASWPLIWSLSMFCRFAIPRLFP